MPVTPEVREKMLISTRERASAFIEDMRHIRGVLARVDPLRDEIRRLSGILRRLLIDEPPDLLTVASPRVGRVVLLAPDNQPFYRAEREAPFEYFESGGVETFGIWVRAGVVDVAKHKPRKLDDFVPDRMIQLRLDNFLNQRVLCLRGEWATRRNVIKYVAIRGSGVHSKDARDPHDLLLSRVRRSVHTSLKDDTVEIGYIVDAPDLPEDTPFIYRPDAIDPVLTELLATAHFLAISPDIIRLEEIVGRELGV